MRILARLVLILFASACGEPPPATLHVVVGDVVVTEVAPDVYAAIRQEPLGLAVNANSLFIVGDEGVVVVDAQFTRRATLENLAALRQVTGKPVRYVVHTHWHDDHVAGAQVYRDSFPGVRFLAHANTKRDMVALGRENREQQVRYAPAAADRFERLLAMGLGGDSTAVTRAEELALSSSVRIIREYVAETADFVEILPETLDSGRTVLPLAGRSIELRWFGRGNTSGDLVVWLPRERILATGDLVVWPVPFAFNSHPTEWTAVLDSIGALEPAIVVPGHGPLMSDLKYVRMVQSMLHIAREEVRSALRSGMSPDSVAAELQLSDLRNEVAGDDKWMRTMFGMFFRRPVVGLLIEELSSRDVSP
ncbi:MAG: MBL fold metallo-hydrolase [Gemmatimonadaceae bacterium]|nr:MBL fold metallo-hydrolase [Gemmatimonadaceae bacterium]